MSLFRKYGVLFQKTRSISWLHQQNCKLSVLGIETSCDDTGIAVVQSDGKVLGNVTNSQQGIHLRYGGIIPPRAQELHRSNIEQTYLKCIENSGIDPSALDAIAVTTRPGLVMSLMIGLRFAKYLGRKYSKPIIPIHHMEAHALTVRMEQKVEFPFLCLLISGGHSQLVFIKKATEFYLLGESLDDAPGEAFDKISRRLRLNTMTKFANMNGGQAIETAAKEATCPDRYEFPLPLSRYKDCNFSFAGLKNNSIRTINAAEIEEKTRPDDVIIHYKDFCAGFLKATTRHISNRTQRALEFCLRKKLFDNNTNPAIVVSGGVANNDYIFDNICNLGQKYGVKAYRPSKQFCSDNGAMIAWNGIERLMEDQACALTNFDNIDVKGKCTLGLSLIDEVTEEDIKCKWVKTL
ncbi:probable tRNA N6-adenosine threonylcarbamoyltransferase, mitochondrial [Episyrphus balteatus]|uniref:probable tRNA N6-adenosine threonylcarbamoyltransferase, mitochondrial n=1 Tax=Episyrphus balteatus TaxID=286459 RepID=UPI00248623E6|nr:probable tRNA N6-adenosine threonylcarbamoyltransferase, mitochondrial [Episyrphus balteatus]